MAPAGRPKLGKEKRIRVNITLDPATHAYLKGIGDNNVSMGIHLVVLKHMATEISDRIMARPMPKKRKSVSRTAGG